MSSQSKPAQVSPEDVPFLVHKALQRITDPNLTRDAAVRAAVAACHSVRCGWVRAKFASGNLDVRCLGRFDLDNPLMEELPWPSIVFAVRAKVEGLDGPVVKSALLCLHMPANNPNGWAVTDSEVARVEVLDGTLHVNGRPFCGDPKGPPSLLNGDGPVSRERPVGGQREASHSERPTLFEPAADDSGPSCRSSSCRPARKTPVRRPGSRSKGTPTTAERPGGTVDKSGSAMKLELVLRLLRLLDG